MSNSANVTTAKPKVGGAISMLALTDTLPTSTTAVIDSDAVNLGYISEDGFTNNMDVSVDPIKAWGGDVVETTNLTMEDSFEFTLIEVLNPNVLKLVYGDENVTGSLSEGIAVAVNSKDRGSHAFVVDTVLKGNVAKRLVIPNASISSIASVTYKDDELVGYQVTLMAKADTTGNTHYEYIK